MRNDPSLDVNSCPSMHASASLVQCRPLQERSQDHLHSRFHPKTVVTCSIEHAQQLSRRPPRRAPRLRGTWLTRIWRMALKHASSPQAMQLWGWVGGVHELEGQTWGKWGDVMRGGGGSSSPLPHPRPPSPPEGAQRIACKLKHVPHRRWRPTRSPAAQPMRAPHQTHSRHFVTRSRHFVELTAGAARNCGSTGPQTLAARRRCSPRRPPATVQVFHTSSY